MSVSVCVLASGSSGNCTLIRSNGAALLIDAGLSEKELVRRIGQAGVEMASVVGVCVSHEHSDHTVGLVQLQERQSVPVYLNRGTQEALMRNAAFAALQARIFSTGQAFAVGEFVVEPFAVPHDAYEPVGFIVSAAGWRIGVVTDMGVATSLIRARLRDCHAVVVESNHDEKMLREAKRPEYLKQRILSRQGHLSNRAAAELLAEIAGPRLQAAFLAHLSEECNRGEKALAEARRRLDEAGHRHVRLHLTYPDRLSEIWCAAGEA